MMYRSLMMCAVLGVAMGAPRDASDARLSSSLPVEHREQESQPLRVMETLDATVEAVINSKTAAAIDQTAAQVATLFGEVVDDIGDFVVDSVQDLPQTIESVSQRVGDAVQEGNERVVIVVKGIRRQATVAQNATVSTTDKISHAFNTSQVVASFQNLGERIATTVTRIVGSIFNNMEKIDTAVADSITRVSASASPSAGISGDTKTEVLATQNAAQADNEIRALS